MTTNALRRSLVSDDRLARDPERFEVEPATTTAGGMVSSYRVKARPSIELLERRGALDWRQARAGRRLYRSYALGVCGAIEAGKGTGTRSPGGFSDLQLGAMQDYRMARAAVMAAGGEWPVLFAIAICDQTASAYAVEHYASTSGRMVSLVMRRLRSALDVLADYHEQADAEDDRRC